MSKMRHKKAGGSVGNDKDGEAESKGSGKTQDYTPKNNVEDEADERKKGGRVKKRADGGKVEGCSPKMRLDRKKRKDGGRVGSDKSPLSSAHTVSGAKEHRTDDM